MILFNQLMYVNRAFYEFSLFLITIPIYAKLP
ncbi:hypothetical protein M084_5100, partial [Bacteroides fragilis str. 3988 T1]